MIRELSKDELKNALSLVWDVFTKFEAVNYPESGKKAFFEAIHSDEYLNMLTAFGAFENEKLVGIIATRNEGRHIALFFVDGAYHRQGIGKSLFDEMLKENTAQEITVNSSRYAVPIYGKLGFTKTAQLQEDGGIQFVPMKYVKRR